MLWGLPPGTWLELWSGAIGAFFSAIAAAIVAIGVVWVTNKHQGTLANNALLAQQNIDRHNAARQAMARYISNALELVSRADSWTHDDLRSIGVRLQVAATEVRILGSEFEDIGDVLLRMSRAMRGLAARELSSRDGQVPEFNHRMSRELNLLVSEVSALIPVWWNEDRGEQKETIDRFEAALLRSNAILKVVKGATSSSESESTTAPS